jgi:hypothetical protein
VGGSGKDRNRVPLGSPRTYAKLPAGEAFSYASWVNAVRAGRTFVTNGPLVFLEVEGAGPGETLDRPADAGPVAVKARAESLGPFERLELVHNGQIVAESLPVSGAVTRAELNFSLPAPESGWLAARCRGAEGSFLDPTSSAFAHTSPVYVRAAGRPLPRRRAALPLLRQAVEQTRDWVTDHGRFANPKWKRHLLDLCARAVLRLAKPEAGA